MNKPLKLNAKLFDSIPLIILEGLFYSIVPYIILTIMQQIQPFRNAFLNENQNLFVSIIIFLIIALCGAIPTFLRPSLSRLKAFSIAFLLTTILTIYLQNTCHGQGCLIMIAAIGYILCDIIMFGSAGVSFAIRLIFKSKNNNH